MFSQSYHRVVYECPSCKGDLKTTHTKNTPESKVLYLKCTCGFTDAYTTYTRKGIQQVKNFTRRRCVCGSYMNKGNTVAAKHWRYAIYECRTCTKRETTYELTKDVLKKLLRAAKVNR